MANVSNNKLKRVPAVGDVVMFKRALWSVRRVYGNACDLWNVTNRLFYIPLDDVRYIAKDTLSWVAYSTGCTDYKEYLPQTHISTHVSQSEQQDSLSTGALLRGEIRRLRTEPPVTPKTEDDESSDGVTDVDIPERDPQW